jgi:hypothetical protein
MIEELSLQIVEVPYASKISRYHVAYVSRLKLNLNALAPIEPPLIQSRYDNQHDFF